VPVLFIEANKGHAELMRVCVSRVAASSVVCLVLSGMFYVVSTDDSNLDSFDEDDDLGIEIVRSKHAQKAYDVDFRVLSLQDLQQRQDEDAQYVAGLTNMDVRILFHLSVSPLVFSSPFLSFVSCAWVDGLVDERRRRLF
jgi:hypothetical protein